MIVSGLHSWLLEKSTSNTYMFIKRLSANDTGATGGHQVGIYIPTGVVEHLFPSINHVMDRNPSVMLNAHTSSHNCPDSQARAVYYNSRFFGKTRNEKRITRWGVGSPLQDPENTGALALLAFDYHSGLDSLSVDIWVCRDIEEEDIVESSLGEIVPGSLVFGAADKILGGLASKKPAHHRYRFPEAWKTHFPSGREIIQYAATHYAPNVVGPDKQLVERRRVEYEIFLLVEEMHVLGVIQDGFGSVNEFILLANSVSNRRKSRAGKSLELHLEQLFNEYGLTAFETQAVTEGNKKPDFLFPSAQAYHDETWPQNRLRMLAVKTTCKDRWRQILNEADRVKDIYLFTLQEGVSIAQFQEMQQERVKLVVPLVLHDKYPKVIREHLMSLETFINDTKNLTQ
ncbi:restriction endonuclease [Serratia fonticola]|nr:restriction endonuclease [Serratia fonticola]